MWQLSFVAMSVTLGEPLEAALITLGHESVTTSQLVVDIRSQNREARARALAEHLAPIAAEVEALELTWPA
jgi:hypothetical protein